MALNISPGAWLHAQVAGYSRSWPPVTYAISATRRDLDSQEKSRSREISPSVRTPLMSVSSYISVRSCYCRYV